MRHTLKLLLLAPVLLGASATATRADITLYSDTTTFAGNAHTPGGAAIDGATPTSASTAMAADDITVAAGGGGASVTSFTFSVVNLNSSAVSANVDLRFYGVGANGGPGTLLQFIDFIPLTIAAGSVELCNYSSATPIFTVPQSGTFYVGEFFTNDGPTATATTAQLNELALGLYNPPTVGSSNNSFYQTSAGGSENLTDGPTGGFGDFGSNAVANFGFAFSGTPATPAVPEPASAILLGMGGLGASLIARGLRGRKEAH